MHPISHLPRDPTREHFPRPLAKWGRDLTLVQEKAKSGGRTTTTVAAQTAKMGT
jgi:hypothetical protein